MKKKADYTGRLTHLNNYDLPTLTFLICSACQLALSFPFSSNTQKPNPSSADTSKFNC